ncbi:hypothetical protein BCR42DRAFT_413301 [Absidia repens]|uniref:Uncharacterized protein n=1 Tax=Absidia repens TaxID=90262 RepID=A0A1X2IKT4_9FUNG|nr:hypothetical protein BCR42DRAFT_413301 [Absidia repens]
MDDHWCTNCDKAINAFSNSLYCSEECLRADALNHHPLLGYDYAELKNFPRSSPTLSSSSSVSSSSLSQSPIPSFILPSPQSSPPNHHHQQRQYTNNNKTMIPWDQTLSPPPVFELEPKLNTPPASPKNTAVNTTKRPTMFFI